MIGRQIPKLAVRALYDGLCDMARVSGDALDRLAQLLAQGVLVADGDERWLLDAGNETRRVKIRILAVIIDEGASRDARLRTMQKADILHQHIRLILGDVPLRLGKRRLERLAE